MTLSPSAGRGDKGTFDTLGRVGSPKDQPLLFLPFVLAALAGAQSVSAEPPREPVPSQDVVVERVLALEHPLSHGEYAWDDTGVPPGPLTITADLEAETMSVFRGGYEIGTAAILYGAPEHPTPLGTFRILQKRAKHVSNLYNAPMPYMLRLTNDGVAIHGSNVAWGYASHGCLGVPLPFAELLFAQAKIGDRVMVTSGKSIRVGEVLAVSAKNVHGR